MTPNPLATLHRGLPIKVSDSDRKQKQFLQTACKNIAPSKWLMDCFFCLVHYRLMCFSLSEPRVSWYPHIFWQVSSPSQPWGQIMPTHGWSIFCNFRNLINHVPTIFLLPRIFRPVTALCSTFKCFRTTHSFYIVKCLNWIPLYEIVIIPWTWMTPTSEHLAVTWSFFDRVKKN